MLHDGCTEDPMFLTLDSKAVLGFNLLLGKQLTIG
jgi:hypothetical protein